MEKNSSACAENRELKRANGILETSSAYSSESQPTHDQMSSYIDAYKISLG